MTNSRSATFFQPTVACPLRHAASTAMKPATLLLVAGFLFIGFGVVFMTTYGCRAQICPPSQQQVSFAGGAILTAVSAARFYLALRRPAASRQPISTVFGAVGLLAALLLTGYVTMAFVSQIRA